MEAPDGRRLLVGWMGFLMAKRCCNQPESIIGSIKDLFSRTLIPEGKIVSDANQGLAQLREAEHFWQGKADHAPLSKLNAWKWTSFRRVSCI